MTKNNPGFQLTAVGSWNVDEAGGRLSRQGAEVHLEPRVMTVLVELASRAGEVVSREELEESVWKGMVVGYDALAGSINKLRKALGDNPKEPAYIETVSKKGYRLIASVEFTEKSQLGQQAAPAVAHEPASPNNQAHHGSGWRGLPASRHGWLAFTIACIVTAVLMWFSSPAKPPSDAVPSIAVMPFNNIGGEADQEYFSDGITADLITDLSRLPGLMVIARNSVFAYRGATDTREIGRALKVRYVLEGSVRRSGNQVRITAQLSDAKNGYNLWAERFDGEMKDVFALQDSVNRKIVNALRISIPRAKSFHSTDNVAAYDLFLRGWQHFWRFNREDNRLARDYYRQAVELDPNFGRAYGNLSLTHSYDFINGWSEQAQQSLDQAYYFARKAVQLNPELPQVHWSLGTVELFNRRYEQALASANRVLELSPNLADGYGLQAATLNYSGKPEKALGQIKKAMRLNPLYPFIYLVIQGEIQFNLKDYQGASQSFQQALARNPEAQEPRLWLAAALAYMNQIDEAEWQLVELRQLDPSLSPAQIKKVIPFRDNAQYKHFLEGLRKAGLRVEL